MSLQANRKSQIANRKTAFTLIELLVVIGIIAVLISLLVPAVMSALRGGDKARLNAHLQAIVTALEAYKTDFGGYPITRADLGPSVAPAAASSGDASSWDNKINANGLRGARLLAKALVGPQSAVYADNRAATNTAPRTDEDGADGPGFRVPDRTGELPARSIAFQPVAVGTERGRVYGPYLNGAYGKVSNTDATGALVVSTSFDDSAVLVDPLGKPVLYFVEATQNLANVSIDGGTPTDGLGGLVCDSSGGAVTQGGLFDINDNKTYMDTDGSRAVRNLGRLLGDRNNANSTLTSGHIGPGENLRKPPAPYLLWFAGPDRNFGITSGSEDSTAQSKLDDVTNIAP